MSSVVISVARLAKRYRLGQIGRSTFREDVGRWWAGLRGADDPTTTVDAPDDPGRSDGMWALRDVTLDVHEGEVVGIIGRNGAGKSTLLKIVSRITAPTSGEVRIRGRLASLLEVGTGFHPDLTGRENVYLNGAILGMRRREIDQKFDEIAEFSGIETFLDTPVKRYSSGMYVRLAFAVAAHLDPDILIVDEVLAVGDVAFQKRCLGRMNEAAKSGRTVLLVSHNLAAIRQLCSSCLWLDGGRIARIGDTAAVVTDYVRASNTSNAGAESAFPECGEKEAQVRWTRLMNRRGEITQNFECDEPVILQFLFQVHRRIPGLYGYLAIDRLDGTTVMVADSFDSPPNPLDGLAVGRHVVRVVVPARSLGPGAYQVVLSFTSDRARTWCVDTPGIVGRFTLTDHTTRRGNNRAGYFGTLLPWHVESVPEGEGSLAR